MEHRRKWQQQEQSVVIRQLSAQKLTDQVLVETSPSAMKTASDYKKKTDAEVFKVESKS